MEKVDFETLLLLLLSLLLLLLLFSERIFEMEKVDFEKKTSEKVSSANEVKEALEKQMDGHREQHQKQINALRDEIHDKQNMIDQIREWVTFSTTVYRKFTVISETF